MTIRLYQADAFCREFTARVTRNFLHEGRPAVVIDQTAFYPSAGGQPNDLGQFRNEAGEVSQVIDVIDAGADEIMHVLAQPLAGAALTGAIDWPRRIDHMQQHSGQHVLSRAFIDIAALDTIAVHIGAQECTLDLPSPSLSQKTLDAAEDAANQAIYANLPVKVYQVTDAELASVPLRKPPKVSGLIRIVEIAGYDWSACGGTHVAATGQIGLIKLIRAEKRGAETRVTFRCGRRALLDYRQVLRETSALAESLTVGRADLAAAVAKLRDEARAAQKALAVAQTVLNEAEAATILQQAQPNSAGWRIISRCWPERDMKQLQAMAKSLTAGPGVLALLGGYGPRTTLCFARSQDAGTADMAALLRGALTTLAEGKGGGSPAFAQGGGGLSDADTLTALLAHVAAQAQAS